MLHFSRTWSASSSLCVLSSCALLFFLLSASAAASMPVTFKGTVAMVDGRIDPATVKVVLSQRTGEGTKDLVMKSTFLKVPQKFYSTFRGDDGGADGAGAGSSAANGQRQQLRPQGEFSFQFDKVPVGTHTLDIISVGVIFPQYRVEVNEGDGDFEERILVSLNQDPNKIFRSPLKVKPMGTVSFFSKRSNFLSLNTLLKNPMYVIIGLTAVAALFLPKMMDPQAMEEMQREMQRMEQARSEGGNNRVRAN